MKKYAVKISYIRDVLGSQPANDEIRRKYIKVKMTTGRTGVSAEVAMNKVEKEIDLASRDKELAKKIKEVDGTGLTVFYRDEDGKPSVSDIQVRGFLKSAFAFVAIEGKLIRKKAKADGTGGGAYGEAWYRKWIGERISFVTQYAPIPKEIETCSFDRSLTAQTPQGPRTAITASECAKAPFDVTFEFITTDDVPIEFLTKAFDRGIFRGISQWSNGQWGTFHYELETIK